MIRFDGQIALITGAGRGLGRTYAVLLAERGARVIVHDAGVDRDGHGHDRAVAEAVVSEIEQAGGLAEPAYEDLRVRGSARSLVEGIDARHGRLDVVVHSAGIAPRAALEDTTDDLLDRVVAINARSAIELTRAAIPIMARRRYGRIVLTVSGHGLYPGPEADLVAYGVSKAMQFGLMNGIAQAAAEDGILVNAVSPVAATRMLTRTVEPGTLRPEDVAAGVAFLASQACDSFGLVLRAAGRRFSIGTYAVNTGTELPPVGLSPEAIAAAWPTITSGPFHRPRG